MVLTEIKNHCDLLTGQFGQITNERKDQLDKLASLCRRQLKSDNEASILIVCTHNSRRSHFAEIWLQIAKAYYSTKQISFHSAGTEATAVFAQVLTSMQKVGISNTARKQGGHYVEFSVANPKHLVFSKRFDDPSIPNQISVAVMVCDDAAENCPLIPGAKQRFSLAFKDPKYADGTDEQAEAYDLTRDEIGREMFYLLSQIN